MTTLMQYWFCRRFFGIPVIMVTGISSETGIDLESFLTSGSEKKDRTATPRPEGYIQKPIDPNKLMTLIKEFFK